MKYTPEQIEKAYNNLPQSLKEAIDSQETTDIIFAIRKKFGLTIDQMGGLSEEIGDVFLGLSLAGEFLANIEKRLEIPREKVVEIGKTVDDMIFMHIRARVKDKPSAPPAGSSATDKKQEAPPAKDTPINTLPKPETPSAVTTEQKNIVPAIAPTPLAPTIPTPPRTPSLIEQKLAAPFSAPVTEVKNADTIPRPPVRTADPYREPME